MVNGIVHTFNEQDEVNQAIAISDGKIVAVGSTSDLKFDYDWDSLIDLEGKSVYPGLYDPHSHFYGYSQNLFQVNLVGTTSWEEVIAQVDSFAKNQASEWVIGRGWDQTRWSEIKFPTNSALNEVFPDRPVILYRIDGHAAIANQEALDRAGITRETRVDGGMIGRSGRKLTGLLVDAAMDLVKEAIPEPSAEEVTKMLQKGEENLFKVGLTTVSDAGLDKKIIMLMDSLQQAGALKIRIHAMANPTEENFDHFLPIGPYKTDRMHVSAFKVYGDGALGSRGAALLEPYSDDPDNYGLIQQDEEYFREVAQRLYEAGFQMNTHCIGDSANRMLLRIYGEVLGGQNDRRWRIEHAQVIHPTDFSKFKEFSIIPSVQPTHATSDRRWAENRIGNNRLKGAYAYKTLFEQNQWIAFGSDFPVEDIDPILGYYAAVTRKDLTGAPYGGFLFDQHVGRDTALKAMTIWAAKACFEDEERGSVEAGKMADLVVFDENPLFVEDKQIPYVNVLMTMVGGEIVYLDKQF